MYQTIAQAQIYFDTKLNTRSWDIASTADRTDALTEATSIIDHLPLKSDFIFIDKQDTDIPTNMKEACNDIALSLLDNKDIDMIAESVHIIEEKFANIREMKDPTFTPEHLIAGIPSFMAWKKLKPYCKNVTVIKLLRRS